MCHSVQMVQVFVNLLKNSYDALEKVPYPKIKIWSEVNADSIKLFFEDNGLGIPTDIQAKIFSPFFTTKPSGKGTGLGLSLSQHIIQQHNGSLSLDAQRGPSCFCIQMPLAMN
jgi:signal transduction histidine kinase